MLLSDYRQLLKCEARALLNAQNILCVEQQRSSWLKRRKAIIPFHSTLLNYVNIPPWGVNEKYSILEIRHFYSAIFRCKNTAAFSVKIFSQRANQVLIKASLNIYYFGLLMNG